MTIISQVQLLVTPAWAARRMKGSERSVYMEIALYADKEGVTKKRSAFPAIKTIAEGVEMEERQVRRLLKSMDEKGVIRIEKRPGSSSIIHLPLDEPTPDMDVRTTPDMDVRTNPSTPDMDVRTYGVTPDMDVRTKQGGPDMDVRRNIYIDPIKENNDHDPDRNDRRTRSVKTKATVVTTPEELLFASKEVDAWIEVARRLRRTNSQIQKSLMLMASIHVKHNNEQYIKDYLTYAANKDNPYYSFKEAWVEEYIEKRKARESRINDFIPSSSMAVPKVSPRDALVAKYGGKDVYMRLEEDGPIYITALHKADGVTGGLNDDYMVELWIDGKPRYIDYAEVESLMTTKEEYEGWNAFLNLF